MARGYSAGASYSYISNPGYNNAAVKAYSLRFRVTNDAGGQIFDAGWSAGGGVRVEWQPGGTIYVEFRAYSVNIFPGNAATGLSPNTWYHLGIRLFQNDGNAGNWVRIGGAPGYNQTTYGTQTTDGEITFANRNTHDYGLSCEIADFAAWKWASASSAPGAGFFEQLADGVRPTELPRGLAGYFPMVRGDIDAIAKKAMTHVGTPTVVAHPRIILPRRRTTKEAPAAGGGVSGDAEISVGAAVDAAGTKTAIGAATVDAGAAVAAAGVKVASGSVVMSAGVAVQASGAKAARGDVIVDAGAAVVAVGTKTAIGAAGVDAGIAVDGAGRKTAFGTAEISEGAEVVAIGGSGVGGSVVISIGVQVSASGTKGAVGQAAIGAACSVQCAGAKTAIGQATANAGAEIIAIGSKRAIGAVVIASAAEIISTWGTQRFGNVVIATAAVVIAAGAQVGAGDVGKITLTGRVDGPAQLSGRHEPTIQLKGRK